VQFVATAASSQRNIGGALPFVPFGWLCTFMTRYYRPQGSYVR